VYGIDPNSPLGQIIAAEIAGVTDPTEISDTFAYYAEEFKLGPYAPKPDKSSQSSGGYSGSQQSQAAAQAFEAAEAEKARAFEAQQAALALEEKKRSDLLATATNLLQGRQGVRQRAREQRVELAGNDPFRFTAALHQQSAGDTATPYDQMKSNLANITNSALPTINASAGSGELQGVVDKLNAMEAEENNFTSSPFVGMAGGGALPAPTSPNQMPQFGGVGYGVLVGDRSMNGDEEVVVNRPDGTTEIIPLIGHAADGAVLPLPNLTVFPQLFKNLRSDMFGTYGGNSKTNDTNPFGALGFSGPQKAGTTQAPDARFGQGLGALAQPLSLERGLLEAGTDPATARQISAQIGTLPNPRNASRFLSRLPPTERQAVISLYKLAGVPEADFDALVQSAAAPAGVARQSLSYG
jgi:hypothetical protein